jgi:hypothetical protein
MSASTPMCLFSPLRFFRSAIFFGLVSLGFASPPSILTQPSSLTVDAGNAANLSVSATGTAPLTYQWYKNDVLLSGETGTTLFFAAAQIGDTASYRIKVTNAEGFDDSANAGLVVVSSYPTWATYHGLTTGQDAFAADYDADGIENLLEYFLGLHPTVSNPLGLPSGVIEGSDFAFRFNRSKSATAISYRVLQSADLVTWASVSGLLLESSTDVSDTFVVRLPLTSPRMFVRLEVRSGASTVATVPIGFMNFPIAGGTPSTPATTVFGIPLDDMSVPSAGIRAGRIESFTTTTITNASGAWTGSLSATAAPWQARLTSSLSIGKTFSIGSNTATTFTVSGADLTTFGLTGGLDTFELVPMDTLWSLFGSTLLGGTSASTSDNVQVRSGTSWLAYFYDTSLGHWRRTIGPVTNSNNVLIRPQGGIQIVRRGAALTLTFTGRVPATAFRAPVYNASTTAIHAGFPTDTTLGAFAAQNLVSGWRSDTIPANADTISLHNGSTWVSYFHNGSFWQPVIGPATNSDAMAIPAGAMVTIQRPGATSGTTDLVRGLPYSLAADIPPAVSITAPVSSASFAAPASFLITATATDSDGAISKVEFHQNGSLLGESTSAPYQYSISGLPAGSYSFTAKATGNTGATTTSSAVTITVTGGGGPDTESPTTPTGLSFSNLGATSFTLTWTASTDNVAVIAYDVFKNGVLAGSPNSPGVDLTGLSPGTAYDITIQARDAAGNSSTVSSTLTVTTAGPIITLIKPANAVLIP